MNQIVVNITVNSKLVNAKFARILGTLSKHVIMLYVNENKLLKQKQSHENELEIQNLVSLHKLQVQNILVQEEFLKRPLIIVTLEI